MNEKNKIRADELLLQSKKNYDNIAESFSASRNYPWQGLADLIGGYLKNGQRVLDIGCGNGRYYPFFKERKAIYTGVDNSGKLIEIARKKYPGADFTIGDALSLPFDAGEFDMAVSLSVIHHIPSLEYRKKFVAEAWRVLNHKGTLILSSWDLRLVTMIRFRQWKRLSNFLKTQARIAFGKEKLAFGDFLVPWQNKYRRYAHVFSLREMKMLARQAGFVVEKSGVSRLESLEGNLYIVCHKMQ